ncbi:hypothetical protein PFISCL1PPCAC_17652, partial [Pristionchus fissidentatus]
FENQRDRWLECFKKFRMHFVTVVVVTHGSDSWNKCNELRLVEMDRFTNNILRMDESGQLLCGTKLLPENNDQAACEMSVEVMLCDKVLNESQLQRCADAEYTDKNPRRIRYFSTCARCHPQEESQ